MSFPFNITNPGFILGAQLTSGEAALVTELAALSPSDGDIYVYRTAGPGWVLETKPASSGSPSWGTITGTLSAQTDLQSALNGKANTSHTHTESAITDLKNYEIKAVANGSLTAALDTFYVCVSNSTFTDPTPVEGEGFAVLVRNGTATIGGTGYSTAGTIVYRIFHSGGWANYVYKAGGIVWSDPIDSNITVDTANTYSLGTGAAELANVYSRTVHTPNLKAFSSSVNYLNSSDEVIASFIGSSGVVNYLVLRAADTGTNPSFESLGTDTNIGINLVPKGTGNVKLGNFELDADQTVGAGQDNYVLTYDHSTGLISLEAASGGGSSITIEDEGTPLTTAVTKINFAGAGVTVTEPAADEVLVTIPYSAFSWEGAWATSTAYVANDVVEHNGSGYVCILAHTSGASTEPGVGASWTTNWDLFVEGTSVTEFADNVFRIQDEGDATKQIAFQASGITTGTTRTITMPDADVTLPNQGTSTTDNVTFANLQITGHTCADAEVDNGNSSTADTINWGTGNFHKSTMTGNCTYTFTAPSGPGRYQLMLVQDATGSRTATWPASVKWPGGTAPTLSTAANAIDIITFYYDGTNYYGVETLDFQ
jgi:hypothetical protein